MVGPVSSPQEEGLALRVVLRAASYTIDLITKYTL